MQRIILVRVHIVRVVKGPGGLDAGRLNHVRFELALRFAPTHEYALEMLLYDNYTLVAEEADLEVELL